MKNLKYPCDVSVPETPKNPKSKFESIHDWIEKSRREEKTNCSIKIKRAAMSVLDEKNKQIRRGEKCFENLQEFGILTNFKLSGHNLGYEVHGQKNSLIGIESPYGSYYASFSSTENSFRQALAKNSEKMPESKNMPISTITGICLFGSGVDQAVTENGNTMSVVEIGDSIAEIPNYRIVDIREQPQFSLYEAEKIKRFASFLNAMLESDAEYETAYLISPRIQYYLYLMPAYEAGKVSPKAYQKWIGLVKQRRDMVFNALQKRLKMPLKLHASPLKEIEESIIFYAQEKEAVTLKKAIEILGDDSAWRNLFAVKVPRTWKELRFASYVVAFLKYSENSARNNVMPIAVDDVLEKTILNENARFQKKFKQQGLEKFPAIGIHLVQNLVPANPDKDGAFYRPQEYTRSDIKAVLREYC